MKSIYTGDDGATTNVMNTSETSDEIITSLRSYRLVTSVTNDITGTNLYEGVYYYLVQSGGGGNATIVTYGGDPYDTHLDIPGIGDIAGYVTDGEFATHTNTQHVLDTNQTARIVLMEAVTGANAQAVTDSSAATNFIGTNTLGAQISSNAANNVLTSNAFVAVDSNQVPQPTNVWAAGQLLASSTGGTTTYATAASAGDWMADGSVKPTANWDFDGYSATNFGDIHGTNLVRTKYLQVTGGSPTNGTVLIATNVLGQTKWSPLVAFRAYPSANFYFTNVTERTIIWNTEIYDYGNNFDGTDFVAPVNGIYHFDVSGHFVGTTGSICTLRIYKNALRVRNISTYIDAGDMGLIPATYESYLTNGAIIKAVIYGIAGSTNYLIGNDESLGSFYGHLIRELP